MPDIITKADAKELGLKRYSTGIACLHGHMERYLSDGKCVECSFQRTRAIRAATPKKRAPSTPERKHLLKIAQRKRWRSKHRNEIAEYQRLYNKKRNAAMQALRELGIEI